MSQFTFNILKNSDGKPLSKRRFLNAKGELEKAASADLLHGKVTKHTLHSLSDLCELMVKLPSDSAATFGVCQHGYATVLSSKRAAHYKGKEKVVTRTRADFSWPEGAGVLLLDYDPKPGIPAVDEDTLIAMLRKAVPDLRYVTMAVKPSVSSCIYDEQGRQLTGINGQHIFLICTDASRIPEIGQIIYNRLWLAGHGYIRLSAVGSMLERSVIDTSVWQPERLVFGQAECGPKISQRFPTPRIFPGEVDDVLGEIWLDPSHIKPLTPDEHKAVARLKERAKKEKQGNADKKREAWIEERVQETAGKNASPEIIDGLRNSYRLATQQHNVMPSELLLHSQRGRKVTVADLLADPDKWHGKRFADPFEPDYGNDNRIAVAYLKNCPEPHIYSHAHGGMRYLFRSEEKRHAEVADDFEDLSSGSNSTQSHTQLTNEISFVDFASLAHTDPPARRWVVDSWLPLSSVTLLAGAGGIGKSLLAQQLAVAVSSGEKWLELETIQGSVLGFFCEDDNDELLRRGANIFENRFLEPASASDGLHLDARAGKENTLVSVGVDRQIKATALMSLIKEECEKLCPTLVIFDNIAQMYGGIENERYPVTAFCNLLTGIARDYNCAVLLLGHPAKAEGSEYSGSTAWEAAVRARLFLSRKDDGTLSLRKAKANYAALEEIILEYRHGVFVRRMDGDDPPEAVENAKPLILQALKTYTNRRESCSHTNTARNYIVKKMMGDDLNGGVAETVLKRALLTLIDTEVLIPHAQLPWKDASRHAVFGLMQSEMADD